MGLAVFKWMAIWLLLLDTGINIRSILSHLHKHDGNVHFAHESLSFVLICTLCGIE